MNCAELNTYSNGSFWLMRRIMASTAVLSTSTRLSGCKMQSLPSKPVMPPTIRRDTIPRSFGSGNCAVSEFLILVYNSDNVIVINGTKSKATVKTIPPQSSG